MTTSEPKPWTCAHCGGRLSWTATTVGCRPCHTVVVLAHARTEDREEDHAR